ncbi:hypothetical protein [Gordonibacter massiliensis (ex Traore et al. 2017)]|uniref:hypothetical protein n=1 Tax=Gordonibacter massiliensis (ex Traore et al. 2017) TaxID=1841863 RepID=UPI001C8C0BA7|nr:hypothetical protein [Gordonibacter massiliensis (ex Traore et al. 2017)]MBX9035331.1 hypothetical protein [Gordonibacter massiliensis (ex Traore et al. 2017)]
MKILGMGFPEVFILIMYVFFIAIFAAVVYAVVKAAVKKAIIEAHDEIEARGKQV